MLGISHEICSTEECNLHAEIREVNRYGTAAMSGLEIDERLTLVVDPADLPLKGREDVSENTVSLDEKISALSSGDRLEELADGEGTGGLDSFFVEAPLACTNGQKQTQQHLYCEQLKLKEEAPTDTLATYLLQSQQIPEFNSLHHKYWQHMKAEQRREQRDRFQLQMMHQQGHSDRLILSIGGSVFETSSQTLCVDSNSMLAAYVLRHLNPGEVLWFDRDGKRFRHVLNYLRNGTIWLEDVPSLRAVQEEAAFFGLTGLQALCEERIRDAQKKEEASKSEELETLKELVREIRSSNNFLHSKGSANSLSRGRTRTRDEPVFELNADF